MKASILGLIGNTPIVRLGRLAGGGMAEVYVKLEYLNPTGSHKDRIAYYMIRDAEERGLIEPGDTVVEASSGNTAISVAWVSSLLGYRAEIFVEKGTSQVKIGLIKALGARVVEAEEESYAEAARRYAEEHGYLFLNQYENEANVRAHYETTGPEIYRQLGGRIDAFVMGIGTGGTISGVGRFLKEKLGEGVKIVGVVPRGSRIAGGEGAERIEGLASDIVPGIWRRYGHVVSEVIEVGFDEALQTMKTLLRSEGILGGLSTGANVYAAMRVAERLTKGVVATIAPDTILRYPHIL
ncbi:MAG TPA: PLP-dependent cysteine synthase family protein [Nitrososphaeria archaeon]|nr:PLP-dependent cysteine synthase family protein [Nitrososphaeria archaeon]